DPNQQFNQHFNQQFNLFNFFDYPSLFVMPATENQQYYIPVYSAANGVAFVPPPFVANMNVPYAAYPIQEPMQLHHYPPPITRPPLVPQERRQNQEPQQPVISSAAVPRPKSGRRKSILEGKPWTPVVFSKWPFWVPFKKTPFRSQRLKLPKNF
ncbi:putative C-hordein, partial [Trichinella spiralis]|uniref:putative C-hordein n=1 Tax=Trichinella spiralis TaxID=6334 RepID=UPI0001EFE83C